MSTDKALAQLVAARLRLFNASQQREAVVLRRVRLEDEKAFDALNVEISDARADVDAATAAVQAEIAAAPPVVDPVSVDPVPTESDIALGAVMAFRDALKSLGK